MILFLIYTYLLSFPQDQDADGYFSVEELSNFLEKHKIAKLVEEGRDAEVDSIIASQAEKSKSSEES